MEMIYSKELGLTVLPETRTIPTCLDAITLSDLYSPVFLSSVSSEFKEVKKLLVIASILGYRGNRRWSHG